MLENKETTDDGRETKDERNLIGRIQAISVSKEKGVKKSNVNSAVLKEDFGIAGDAHAGAKNRQVSLLATESIEKMQAKGLQVKPGDFAENITTEGLDLLSLKLGDKLQAGKNVILEVSQIGKECHTRCSIYYQAGDCVMPKEGIFVKVLRGGEIKVGNIVEVIKNAKRAEGYKAAVLTMSDRCSRGERQDESGKLIQELLKKIPVKVVKYEIIPDELELIQERLIEYADKLKVDLILTDGGTGFGQRDVTPEATRAVIDKEVPGIPEVMRIECLKYNRNAMLSRAVAGIRGRTLIINFPGSPKAVKESLEVIMDIIVHALDMIAGKDH